MHKKILLVFLLSIIAVSPLLAQEGEKELYDPKRPWLTEFSDSLPNEQPNPAPLVFLDFSMADGSTFAPVFTEDVPVYLSVQSSLFDGAPPKTDRHYVMNYPEWTADKPVVIWYLADRFSKRSETIPSLPGVYPDRMTIVPTTPTNRGILSCFANRRMSYYDESGQLCATDAQGSASRHIVVKDITPPLCGLSIKLSSGKTGSCWPVEFPKDKYPLPKTATVFATGSIFSLEEGDFLEAPTIDLGMNMILDEKFAIEVDKDTVMELTVVGGDNHQLDKSKIFFGVCSGAGGNPVPAYEPNISPIEFSRIKMPKQPYLYIDASDVSENRQVMYIPLIYKGE